MVHGKPLQSGRAGALHPLAFLVILATGNASDHGHTVNEIYKNLVQTMIAVMAAGLMALPSMAAPPAGVVINELLYHAPNDLEDLQFVELHNANTEAVDIGGWAFTKGIKFKFPAGTRIEGQGFVLVCQNETRFKQFYNAPIAGVFESKLSHKGERVELIDAAGKRIDEVTFSDKPPWPTGADGHSGSLERISPLASANDPANWISSPLSEVREKPTGTPGEANTGFSKTLPPVISSVSFSPELPAVGEPITVEATVRPDQSIANINLRFRLAGPGFEKPETSVPMKRTASGRYSAIIPGQDAEQLIRFRVEATDAEGARRFFPAETEPRPALSAYVPSPIEPAKIPFAWIIHTKGKETKARDGRENGPTFGVGAQPTPEEVRAQLRRMFGGRMNESRSERGPFTSAFIYFDPQTRKMDLFDFVQINERKSGQKVHLYSDRMLKEMTTLALIFENDSAALVEPLAYEVYRRAGMPSEQSYHVRLWQEGKPAGYFVLIEQPNRAFLRRNKIDDEGNMYKLLWYGGNLIGQHEKHTNVRGSHDDLVAVVAGLKRTTGDAQWDFIQNNFDVEEVATYFAVNMILSHWDGFFNNYFTYHDTKGTGKWMMFPWDQDSTWGLRDGEGSNVFYTMALTFGMTGDKRPRQGGPWRPPGFFSGPLLANPNFRQVFLARTKQILDTVYTETVFGPILDQLAEQLTPEVQLRAQLENQDPSQAVEQLKFELGRCRRHIQKRREFLLRQEELQAIQ